MNKLPQISEKTFLAQVTQVAKIVGWRVYHPWLSIHSERGFPDLTFVRRDGIFFAELKSAAGKVTDKQQDWIDALQAAGQEVYIWRPSDFEEIQQRLLAKSSPDRCEARLARLVRAEERRLRGETK